MTLSEQDFSPTRRDFSVPALATERLMLRAPRTMTPRLSRVSPMTCASP